MKYDLYGSWIPETAQETAFLQEQFRKSAEDARELSVYQQKQDIALKARTEDKKREVERVTEIAQRRADVAAVKELQASMVIILPDGQMLLRQVLFGDNLNASFPFRFESAILYETTEDAQRVKILRIALRYETWRAEMYFLLDKLTKKYIEKKFFAAGVSFGLSAKKEQEVREKLLDACRKNAKVEKVPRHFGWYLEDNKIAYAFPEMLTWKEVNERAER